MTLLNCASRAGNAMMCPDRGAHLYEGQWNHGTLNSSMTQYHYTTCAHSVAGPAWSACGGSPGGEIRIGHRDGGAALLTKGRRNFTEATGRNVESLRMGIVDAENASRGERRPANAPHGQRSSSSRRHAARMPHSRPASGAPVEFMMCK